MWGMEQISAAHRPKNKNILLEVGATGRSPLHSFVQGIASLRSQ